MEPEEIRDYILENLSNEKKKSVTKEMIKERAKQLIKDDYRYFKDGAFHKELKEVKDSPFLNYLSDFLSQSNYPAENFRALLLMKNKEKELLPKELQVSRELTLAYLKKAKQQLDNE